MKLANWIGIDRVMKLSPAMHLIGSILYYCSRRTTTQTTYFARIINDYGGILLKIAFVIIILVFSMHFDRIGKNL